MARVEPVVNRPAAVVETGADRLLVVADYHAGIEAALRYDGVELESRAGERRAALLDLVEETDPSRVVILGDLAHWIGQPLGAEHDELAALIEAIPDDVPLVLVKGNHDGAVDRDLDLDVTGTDGIRVGEVGFVHGHTWPTKEVLAADIVCTGHEHPAVRLEDEVGGTRNERVWLRGDLVADPFREHGGPESVDAELVVFPAFNELAGETWINVAGESFLAPYLPEGIADGTAYLLDGTRLGPYREVS